MNKLIAAGAVALAATAGAAAFFSHRQRSRQRVLHAVMDAADALEFRVRQARQALDGVPKSQGADGALQEVMRDLLRQRLWLQDHGMTASLAELEAVRDTLAAASRRLDSGTTP